MISCNYFCKSPKPNDKPEVIVVDKSPYIKNKDGTYTVTKDWFLDRMSKEQKLMDALHRCLRKSDK